MDLFIESLELPADSSPDISRLEREYLTKELMSLTVRIDQSKTKRMLDEAYKKMSTKRQKTSGSSAFTHPASPALFSSVPGEGKSNRFYQI